MRRVFSSLKTGILTQLTFLIIAAMLLINVVMVKFSERDLIQTRINTGRLLIKAVEQIMKGRGALDRPITDPQFKGAVSQLLSVGGFSEIFIVNRYGIPIFTSGPSSSKKGGDSSARKAMESNSWSIDYRGTTWGVFWLSHEKLEISAPLYPGRLHTGGINISTSLVPIYDSLRKSEKLILLYILLDTIILTIVGIYLLSRIVVRPIQKLLKMTSGYKDGDLIPYLSEAEGNEIGQLSHSLSLMLKRLEDSKSELRENISSLGKANKELKKAQNEIIRSEKLASVGRLAAGIAHEIGNPIGIVLGYLELIRNKDTHETEKKDFLGRIESEITKINRIIRSLLDFSRPSKGEEVEVSSHDLIMNIADILKPQPMMEKITVRLELNAHNDKIRAVPDELQQVFLNIMMNAADAHGRDRTKDSGNEQREIAVKSGNIEDTLEILFKDNGPGITEDSLPHIFDPFFSTKEPGEGTGLGLAVCYRIVESIGGSIRAESGPDNGTSIIITLPLPNIENSESE